MNDEEIVEKVFRHRFEQWYPTCSKLFDKETHFKHFKRDNAFVGEIAKFTISKTAKAIFKDLNKKDVWIADKDFERLKKKWCEK